MNSYDNSYFLDEICDMLGGLCICFLHKYTIYGSSLLLISVYYLVCLNVILLFFIVVQIQHHTETDKDEYQYLLFLFINDYNKISCSILQLDDGLELSFTDKRRFAKVRLLKDVPYYLLSIYTIFHVFITSNYVGLIILSTI